MLGKLTRKHQPHGGLNLAGRQSRLLVVSGKLAGLASNALENIVDERVHDGHSLLANTGIGVNLLEHLVDVRAVGLGTLLALLLVSCLLGSLGGLLAGCLGHPECR